MPLASDDVFTPNAAYRVLCDRVFGDDIERADLPDGEIALHIARMVGQDLLTPSERERARQFRETVADRVNPQFGRPSPIVFDQPEGADRL